jgi:hypothetical protein
VRKRFAFYALGALTTVVAISAQASAAEQGVIRARLELNRVEGRIKGLKSLDSRNAKRLLDQISRANKFLSGCKDREHSDWKAQAKRSQDLEQKLRALSGAAPKPSPKPGPKQAQPTLSGASATFVKKARSQLDAVTKDFERMGPGDMAVANKLIARINAAVGQLNRCPPRDRGAKAWQGCGKLATALDKKVRARAKQKKGDPTSGAKPVTKGQRPEPGKGTVRKFKTTRMPRIPFRYQRGDFVDTLRWKRAQALVPKIEKLMEAGKVAEAKQHLWGLWAQWKRSRSTYKKEQVKHDSLYQRARDAVYGSMPVPRTDDGALEAATQIQSARAALKAGDPTRGTQVTWHVEALVQEGLKLPAETQKAFAALKAEQAKAWKAANAAMAKAGLAMCKAGSERNKVCLEDRIHGLQKDLRWLRMVSGWSVSKPQNKQMLEKYELAVHAIKLDLAASRKAFPAFAASPFDPDFVDLYYASAIKQQAKAFTKNARFLLGAIRGAMFGEEALEALGLPAELWRIHTEVAQSCFTKAERAYQRDRTKNAGAYLKSALSWMKHAKLHGLGKDALARLQARHDELKSSAGVGKLKRTEITLNKVEKALKGATAKGSFDYAKEQLETAKGWLAGAEKGGVAAADLARVKKRYADLSGPAFTSALQRLAMKPVKRAEAFLAEARKHVGKAESAFDALNPLRRIEARLKLAAPFLERLTDAAVKQTVEGRIAKVQQAAAAVLKQVEQNQRLPKDVYTSGGSWRGRFKRMVASEHGWKVLALSLTNPDWIKKTASYEYAGSGNTRVTETRWYKHLHAWVAVQNSDDPERVDLRYVGFRLHKMTDGSYRMLKLYRVGDPNPMLKKNLP